MSKRTEEIIASNLKAREKALLTSLNISTWGASKKDADVTKQVLIEHDAQSDAGGFSKKLLPKEALQEIKDIASTARSFHNRKTADWKIDGQRLIGASNLVLHRKTMEGLKMEFETAVEKFLDSYESIHKPAAMDLLGSMFNSNDYPSREILANKFKFEVSYEPIPSSQDLNIQISEEALSDIAAEIEERTALELGKAMEKQAKTGVEMIKAMMDSIRAFSSEETKCFKDSVVLRAQEFIENMEANNILGDPVIEEIIRRARDEIFIADPKEMRSNPALMERIVNNGQDMLDKVKEMRNDYGPQAGSGASA